MPFPLFRQPPLAAPPLSRPPAPRSRLATAAHLLTVLACGLILSSFSGCALPTSLSPRPATPPWEARPVGPVHNAVHPDTPPGHGWDLRHPSLRFGGLSGMTLPMRLPSDPPDRLPLLAVSDRGALVRFFLRPDGSPDPSLLPVVTPLTGPDHQPLLTNRSRDAEDIVTLPDGRLLISFEQTHRLWVYPPDPAAAPAEVPLPDTFGGVPNNRGIEAMAVHPDGRLLLVQEHHGDGPGGTDELRAWVGIPDPQPPLRYRWSARRIAASGSFDVSGALTLPSGAVLLLERDWSFPLTFHTRIRRLDAALWDNGQDLLNGPDVFRLAPIEMQENYESLVARPPSSGADVDQTLLILSDNNFLNMQRTLLLDIGRLADLDGSQR